MYGALAKVLLFLAPAIALPLNLAVSPWQASSGGTRVATLELRLAEETPGEGLIEAMVEHSDKRIYLARQTLVTNEDLIDARVVEDQGLFRIDLRFTEEGAQRMARATGAHIGKPIAILIDGAVVSAPIVRSMVSDRAAIAGGFTKEEAEKLASRITSK